MNEKEMGIVAAAGVAHALLVQLDPIMQRQRDSIISEMMNVYRSGKLDGQLLVSHVAQLCVLEDLSNSLKGQINKGKNLREDPK